MPWESGFHLTGMGTISSMGSAPGPHGCGCRMQTAMTAALKYGTQENVTPDRVWTHGHPGDWRRPWPGFKFLTMHNFHSDKRTI